MKRGLAVCALCLAVCMAMYAMGTLQKTDLQCAVERGELLRIHILAHDDSTAQQAVKLKVRDAILARFTPLFADVADAKQAAALVQENLDLAAETARQTVRAQGCDYPVRVQYGQFDFPERVYGGQVVPAGRYTALRIELGDAKGHNWWCVMYPPLCFSGEDYTGEVRFESGIAKWLKRWKEAYRDAKEA